MEVHHQMNSEKLKNIPDKTHKMLEIDMVKDMLKDIQDFYNY